MAYYRRKRSRLWLPLLLIAVVLLSIPFRTSSFIKSTLNHIFSPFLKAGGAVYRKTADFKDSLRRRKELMRENDILKQKLETASKELSKLREKALENDRLTRLLDFKRKGEFDVIPARVIGRDPSSWSESVFIDKGAGNGVSADMPVVTAEGLTGKVVEVSGGMSKVLLIIDKNSRAGAMAQISRDYGIIEGTGTDTCRMNYLSRNAAINVNDTIVSSGLGAVYPKGIVIGKVTKVGSDNFELYKYADVAPACDFSKLEEVLVLKVKTSVQQAASSQEGRKKR